MSVVLLVMLLVAFPFIDPGSASMVVAQLTLLMLVPSVLGSAALIYRESRRGPDVPVDLEDR